MSKKPQTLRIRFESLAEGDTFFRFLYGDEVWRKVSQTSLGASCHNAISTFSGKTADMFDGALVVRTD